MPTLTNVFDDVPPDLPEELFRTLLRAPGLHIERITSHGHASPPDFWYDQDTSEWILLLRGAARLRLAGPDESVDLLPGSFLNIPAHKKHRVDWTDPAQPTLWLAIHYVA